MKVERCSVPVPQFLPWSHGFSTPLNLNNGCSLGHAWIFGLYKPTCSFASYFHTIPQPRENPQTSVCGLLRRRCWHGAQHRGHRTNVTLLRPSLEGWYSWTEAVNIPGAGAVDNLLPSPLKRRAGLSVVLFVVTHMGRDCPASPQCSLYLAHLFSLSLFLINLLNASFQSCSQ